MNSRVHTHLLRLKPFALVTCSWIGLILIFPIAQAKKIENIAEPEIHSHQERCISCHLDGVDVTQLFAKAGNECLQCHDVMQLRANMKRIIEKEPAVTDSSPSNEKPATLGMSLPMYYEQSRLGDQPNEMIAIPAGAFIKGTHNRQPDEGPQHTVNTDAYLIDKYEVSNLQYAKFNKETKRKSPRHFRNRTYPPGKVDHPVVYVSWFDADAYCRWAGKRLPTDSEWEKAARGLDARIFPWGDQFAVEKSNTPVRWEAIGLFGDTTPVGSFSEGVSVFGLHDTSGNVWEWTASWYEAYPGNTTPSESYGKRYKTLKGGSWFDCSFYKCGISAPTFNRAFFAPSTKNDSFGFRCAKDMD
ncbi:MAG: formylglycine-generating enzyme family protein [Gammaproteobacteria bacterium]|nr:formylglycine-generating enzyme family protein [Gammaproteobacteria bacterium]